MNNLNVIVIVYMLLRLISAYCSVIALDYRESAACFSLAMVIIVYFFTSLLTVLVKLTFKNARVFVLFRHIGYSSQYIDVVNI